MDALQKVNEDVNILLNTTDILTWHPGYHQIYTYACTILIYLRNSLTYMRHVTTHTMDYIDAAMTNILSPDLIPVEQLRGMIRHIRSQLPSIMHLPISLDNSLHFYQYPQTHILVADGHIFAPHRCIYTRQSTTTPNIWDLQPTISTWQCSCSAQNL